MSKTEVILEADLPINETVNVTSHLPKILFNQQSFTTDTSTQLSIINQVTSVKNTVEQRTNFTTVATTT